jgi:hypothetical protein
VVHRLGALLFTIYDSRFTSVELFAVYHLLTSADFGFLSGLPSGFAAARAERLCLSVEASVISDPQL